MVVADRRLVVGRHRTVTLRIAEAVADVAVVEPYQESDFLGYQIWLSYNIKFSQLFTNHPGDRKYFIFLRP